MIIPPINLDPVLLAARAANVLSQSHRIAYAQLSPQLAVMQHSPNFVVLLEEPAAIVAGQPISDLLGEFVGLEETLQEILGGTLPEFRLEMVNRAGGDGSICYLNFLVTPLEPEQPEQGLLLLAEDVTENGRLQQAITQDRNELRLLQSRLTQANEKLRWLNQMKSLFLAMAAHDLRSPLSVISGYADITRTQIARGEVDEVAQNLCIIGDQANHLNYLISDLLDLDAIERGELALKLDKVDLVALLKEIINTLPAYFCDKNTQLEVVLPETPCYLWLDARKIQRVFYNLLTNAYKYTPPIGRIKVQMIKRGEEIITQITDNGYGLNEEQLEHLFRPYFRSRKARASVVSGSGLGLYIVKTFVEAHGGSIQVNSQPKQGSTFTIFLPVSSRRP